MNGADWRRLFDSFEDAEREVKRLNSLYFDGFQYRPFLKIEKLEKNKEDLIKIEHDINKMLKGFEGFNGVDFCDVSAGGIQIRGHRKQVKGYTYGRQPTIKYDFSNKKDVVVEFVEMRYNNDEDKKIVCENEMIRQGEKWGWD